MKKVRVNKSKCIGCGTCVAIASKSFKLGDDAKVEVINPPGDDEVKIGEAIDSCPVDALEYAN